METVAAGSIHLFLYLLSMIIQLLRQNKTISFRRQRFILLIAFRSVPPNAVCFILLIAFRSASLNTFHSVSPTAFRSIGRVSVPFAELLIAFRSVPPTAFRSIDRVTLRFAEHISFPFADDILFY